MSASESLTVRAGQSLTARLWNAFWAERRRQRLIAGPGVRLREGGNGVVINFNASLQPFLNPFKVNLNGNIATVRFGTVNLTIEPTIHGVPISGNEKAGIPVPELELDFAIVDKAGKTNVAVEVETDETGKAEKAKILQVATIKPGSNQWPLAIIYVPPDGAPRKFQHTYFNLRHWSRATGSTVRHFFSAQP